jgi:hypothetical protein
MVLRAHGLTMALGESKRIWLGVVFTDCAFSHSGLLLGFDVQRIGSKQCIASRDVRSYPFKTKATPIVSRLRLPKQIIRPV